jgi:hypothetical protein
MLLGVFGAAIGVRIVDAAGDRLAADVEPKQGSWL